MDSIFNNYDIIKLIIEKNKNNIYILYKLFHTSKLFRNEIKKLNINIIKDYNIYQLKKSVNNNINFKLKKDNIINIIKNLKEIIKYYSKGKINEQEDIKLFNNKIIKYKEYLNNINNNLNKLNLKIINLRKKTLFLNTTFIESKSIPLQIPYYPYITNYVNNIKLKYIIKNSQEEYEYIENLFYNNKSKILHLTSCSSLNNCDIYNCNFIKLDSLNEIDNLNIIYCKKCTNLIREELI